jgi:hypothetical protein
MLPDGGHLSCFRRLNRRHTAKNPNPNRGHFDGRTCCQNGCTAQLVSESAQRGVREVPDTRDGVLIADLCELLAASNEAAVGANFQSRDEEDDMGA